MKVVGVATKLSIEMCLHRILNLETTERSIYAQILIVTENIRFLPHKKTCKNRNQLRIITDCPQIIWLTVPTFLNK